MLRRKTTVAAALVSVAVMTAACGGSSNDASSSGGGSGGGGQSKTITIGIMADMTGLGAPSNKQVVDGVKAGAVIAAKDGYKIKYVVGDTGTNPGTTLPAAQKLVQQNNVLAVIAHSSLTFAAAPYLTKLGVPVVGAGEDGPEWTTSKNMFSVFGALHAEKVATTTGELFKLLGVANVGTLGYGISPVSSMAAKSAGVSAESAGLKAGYVNANFAFGSTDVQPVALAMKQAGVDAIDTAVTSSTAFALIGALRNLGVNLKAPLLATGYGGELLSEGEAAIKAAQGVYFTVTYEPMEMNTDATKQFADALKSAGVTAAPSYATYNGYASVLLLVQALKAAGGNPTRASLLGALANVHEFTAGGLFGDHKLDPNDRESYVAGVDNCQWVTKLNGSKFELVEDAEPICGKVVAGKTVTPGS